MTQGKRELFKDREHLLRMAGILASFVVLFIVLQQLFVPKTFGDLGHYRAAAIGEIAALPVVHAGRAACAECHADVVAAKAAGKHARLGCEGCHGALAAHAKDPVAHKPKLPDTKTLCPVCHAFNPARPAWFKQVNVAEHSSGEACNTCHQPHAPQL